MAIPLLVPENQYGAANRLGAVWDNGRQMFVWPKDKPQNAIAKWVPRLYRTSAKPPHIKPLLVPSSMWGINVRSLLPREKWKEVSDRCRGDAGWGCQVCGENRPKPHCHEQWAYEYEPDDPQRNGTQRLVRLVSLCRLCHDIKHLGRVPSERLRAR